MLRAGEPHRDDLLASSPVSVKDVTLAVVTYNSALLLPRFLSALPAALEGVGSYELTVVDNASTDDTLEVARTYASGATVVALDHNSGYAGGVNAALATSQPSAAIYVLNPDTILQPGSVRILLDALESPGVGIAVPRMLSADGRLDASLRREPTLTRALGTALLGKRAGRWAALGENVLDPECYCRSTTADWAVGAALMVSRACATAVGPWDETFFLYSEETDFCLRARDLGFGLRLVPDAVVIHIGGRYPSECLYSMLVWNKYRLYRRRHGVVRATAFRCALILGEALRAAAGKPLSKAALAALLIPARRPPEVGRTW
ncbi:MAG: glycosyltransferase family 2 protein [Egibacteraceae bacterium]